ncbi:MAG: hypothetical protein LBR08_00215, partial [Bacteroidales bacterium]|nr:hypothetical protein [Bacteroidales bacterium]
FVVGKSETAKIKIDKNNFIIIYNKWLQTVKPTIAVNWDLAKKKGIIDGDFYLADLLALENKTLKEKLYVLLKFDHYEMDRIIDEMGLYSHKEAFFSDNQKAHHLFWNKYERPPREEYWDYIVKRRDLLVPQDVRERKGSFFTPQIWVELSQRYIADVFGADWQDEYCVWDCAAGTGNLLAGLTNKYNIWASTLDKQDVDVMHDRIDVMNRNSLDGNGSNLLHDHVFQFDFLNDSFDKLPQPLQNIINDEQKRKKLIIYINPPYAEASSTTAVVGTGNIKSGVATEQKTKSRYQPFIGAATNEISAQFMARIYHEIAGCKLSIFSKLKFVCTQHFITFRKFFKADYKAGFVVHADTFDNVSGKFPIAFTVWDLNGERFPDHIEVDVPEEGIKKIFWDDFFKSINDWIKQFQTKSNNAVGFMVYTGNDFNRLHLPYIMCNTARGHLSNFSIADKNLMETAVYFTVRLCIEPTWLNDRDQFLYPNDGWKTDAEFQNDCLTFALFHGQNRISVKDGVNHWIPFTEQEVNAREKFDSRFMSDFIAGKIKQENSGNLFSSPSAPLQKGKLEMRKFSPEAQAVFAAGKALWRYYHQQPGCNVNASLYDIREHFQGRNDKGKMNSTSVDEHYTSLLSDLREQLKMLAKKIEPKVYEYGFLK